MKTAYKSINLSTGSLDIINTANDIIEEYQDDGMTLTLRQLYYQFVARDILSNTQKSYSRLGRIINDGRMNGLVDWSVIEDRTRFLRGNANWNSPYDLLDYYAPNFTIDMWKGQDYKVEVWIEKDALVGVIEDVCQNNDVDYFACRGYVSQSELYKAGRRIYRRKTFGQKTVVIHLGDHDPSGIDMTRDNHQRLELFSEGEVIVHRIALNEDQINQYNPPPNPAKLTDSRAKNYIKNFGYQSWELDALEPRVMRELIQSKINEFKDLDLWQDRVNLLDRHRETLKGALNFIEDNQTE